MIFSKLVSVVLVQGINQVENNDGTQAMSYLISTPFYPVRIKQEISFLPAGQEWPTHSVEIAFQNSITAFSTLCSEQKLLLEGQ